VEKKVEIQKPGRGLQTDDREVNMMFAGKPFCELRSLTFRLMLLFTASGFCNYPSRIQGQQTTNKSVDATVAPNISPGDIELSASRVFIFVDKTGLGHQHAVEGQLAISQLILGAEKGAGRLVFNMDSFDADTRRARQYLGLPGDTDEGTRKQVNNNMKGREVLDTTKYPQAILDIQSALPTGKLNSEGAPEYEITGRFTLHGVQKPIKFLAYAEKANGWVHLRGDFGIKQSTYGIKPYSKAFGAIGVADALQIYGDLWVAPSDRIDIKTLPEGR
jgi:hypothetical protein